MFRCLGHTSHEALKLVWRVLAGRQLVLDVRQQVAMSWYLRGVSWVASSMPIDHLIIVGI